MASVIYNEVVVDVQVVDKSKVLVIYPPVNEEECFILLLVADCHFLYVRTVDIKSNVFVKLLKKLTTG